MKIINIRDGFVKIETDTKTQVSSFLQIKSTDKNYLAQIVQQKENGSKFSVYAKILFLYINGIIAAYDKTTPALDSLVEEFPYSLIEKTFATKNSLVVGKFFDDSNISVDKSFFNNKFLISTDSALMTNMIASNLAKQFASSEKVIFIDTLGISEGMKFVAGRDFRLPINKESLRFIYEDCLKDATLDSKKMIKDIFSDLSNYSETVDFVPFDVLKSIIDDMVDKEHVFKLMVLKNKLERFKKLEYFASNYQDAKNLDNILKSDYAIIDISKLDNIFQNRYLELIYSEIDKIQAKTKVIVAVSNNINKNNLKTIVLNEYIASVFITHSKFKYLKEIKQFFNTFILENTYTNKNIFNLYSLFFNAMKADEYLIVGEGTNYIPLISKQFNFTVLPKIEPAKEEEQDLEDFVNEYNENQGLAEDKNNEEITEEKSDEAAFQVDETNEESVNLIDNNLELDDMFDSQDEGFEDENDEPDENITNTEIVFETAVHTTPQTDVISEVENDLDADGLSSDVIEDYEPANIDVNDNNSEPIVADAGSIEEIDIPDELTEDVVSATLISENSDDILYEEIIEAPDDIVIEDAETLSDKEDDVEESDIFNEDDLQGDDIISIDITEEYDDEEILFLDESELNEPDEGIISEEDIEKEIIEDVDKVFTEIKEDSISESDLDFIDELNELDDIENLGDELAELSDSDSLLLTDDSEMLEMLDDDDESEDMLSEPIEEFHNEERNSKEALETKPATTTMVPVYEAEIPQEDKVVSDPIEQGDAVVHAKYGTGIVEKMIKYGNKDLYSINFDNIGRRLLDPTLTEIKKA